MNRAAVTYLRELRLQLVRRSEYGKADRSAWHPDAETMIGPERMRSLEEMCVKAIEAGVPGDFIECGVWRGGACILMRAVLKALADPARVVWVADSFRGLPKPELIQDANDKHWMNPELAVSRGQVEANFRKYGLLDERVKFLEGWFKDTLWGSPIRQLAVLRLDGDMYQSTMTCLVDLYARVSPGGYVIVDDYGAVSACREAVSDFRRVNKIEEPIQEIDWTAVYWQKDAA